MIKNIWNTVNDMDEASKYIIGSVEKNIKASTEIIDKYSGPYDIALDFGCGIGRNTVFLSKYFNKIIGYDFDNMLTLFKDRIDLNEYSNITLESNWNNIIKLKVNVTFAILVFQHISDLTILDIYFKELANITDTLILSTRWYIDVLNTPLYDHYIKYFDIIDSSEPISNILEKSKNEYHYTVILKPKGLK